MKDALRIDDLHVSTFNPQPEPEQPVLPAAANFEIGVIGGQSCIGFWCPMNPVTDPGTTVI